MGRQWLRRPDILTEVRTAVSTVRACLAKSRVTRRFGRLHTQAVMDFILNVFGEPAVEAAFQQGIAENPDQVESDDSPFITLAEVAASEVLPRTPSGHPGTFAGVPDAADGDRKADAASQGSRGAAPAPAGPAPSPPRPIQPMRSRAGSGRAVKRQTGAGAVVGAVAEDHFRTLGSQRGMPPQGPPLFRDESDDRRFRRRRRRNQRVGAAPPHQRSTSGATAGTSSLASGLLQMRDLRAVDTAFTVSNVPALLVRRNALLVNMYTIKAIILSRKCFFFLRDGADGELLAMREWLCSGESLGPRSRARWPRRMC